MQPSTRAPRGRSGRRSDAGQAAAAGVAAAAVVLLLGAAAWWRLSVTSKDTAMLPRETWERVKEAYPIPSEAPQALTPESQAAAALIDANPFSPQRDRAVSAADPSGQGALRFAPAAAEPQFAYKGRLQLGARQRAVMEETTAGKTYFLEVGQAVAGFKVLDIDEKRVLLSDPQTHEEVAVPLTSARSP